MTARMFGRERGSGRRREEQDGRERKRRKRQKPRVERGCQVTPLPEEEKKPVSAEARSQSRGSAVVPGDRPGQRERSSREIEVKGTKESRVDRKRIRKRKKKGKQGNKLKVVTEVS